MIFNVIGKITGIEKDAKDSGAAGIIKYAADVTLYVSVLFYLIAVGVILPLYVPGYDALGTVKGQFWIKCIGITWKILIVPIVLYILSFIIRLFGDRSKNPDNVFTHKLKVYSSDIWAVLFCVSAIISRAMSEEKEIALYGERGWYLGMYSYLALGIGVMIVPRLGRAKNLFVPVIMAASFLVAFIGLIMDYAGNVFNLDGWSEARVSTIGNPNWFCGYLITVMFAGAAVFFLHKNDGNKNDKKFVAFISVYMIVTFYMIISQGSASAYPALLAEILALLILAGKDLKALYKPVIIMLIWSVSAFLHSLFILGGGYSRPNDRLSLLLQNPLVAIGLIALVFIVAGAMRARMKKGKKTVSVNIGLILTAISGIAVVIFFLLLVANTRSGVGYLGKEGSIFWFHNGWGASRGATMKAGWVLFTGMTPVEKLFGKGPDTFFSFLMGGRFFDTAQEMVVYFGGSRLTNAHCEPLTMLVNTGIFGTVSFYGLMISIMLKGFKKATVASECNKVTALACSLSILAYIINNIFSFQTAVNVSQLALVLAFGAWAVLPDKSEDR